MSNLTITFIKGGPGSGHHGHQGRPGKRGGSLPSGSGGGKSTNNVFPSDFVDMRISHGNAGSRLSKITHDKKGKPRNDYKDRLRDEGFNSKEVSAISKYIESGRPIGVGKSSHALMIALGENRGLWVRGGKVPSRLQSDSKIRSIVRNNFGRMDRYQDMPDDIGKAVDWIIDNVPSF